MAAAELSLSTDFVAAERANRRHTVTLIFVVLVVGAVVGSIAGWVVETWVLGFPPDPLRSDGALLGLCVFLGVGAIATLVTLFAGRGAVLRVAGARVVTVDEEPLLHNVVEEMAIAAGLPKPQVAIIESDALNAFATGMRTDKAAVAVTRGLLRALTRDELQGVVAHEMGHIRNMDTRYMAAVAIMVGLIALTADVVLRMTLRRGVGAAGRSTRREGGKGGGGIAILLLVLGLVALALAPLFARLVQMAVSRQREYLADATSVRFTRNPQGLVSALRKLESSHTPLANANRAVQHLFIVNPLRAATGEETALMATHQAISQRIARLMNLGDADIPAATEQPTSAASRAGAGGR